MWYKNILEGALNIGQDSYEEEQRFLASSAILK